MKKKYIKLADILRQIKRVLCQKAMVFLWLFLLAVRAAGALENKPPETVVSKKGAEGIMDLIDLATQWLFGALLVVAVIFIILAAYHFLFSGGEAEKVSKAKNMLIYAVIAVAVGTLSRGIVLIIGSFFDEADLPPGTEPDPFGTSARLLRTIFLS